MTKHPILTLLYLITLGTYLHANSLTASQNESYTTAIKYYEGHDYQKSYDILSQLYLDALDDSQLNFFLGRSAYEIGDLAMAIGAYERVSMLDPNNIRNQLELARTQYYAGLITEAQVGFDAILQNPLLPENVRKNVEYFQAMIASAQKTSFFTASAHLGLLYDSNVNLGSSEDTFTLAKGLGTFTSAKPLDDFAHEESIMAAHVYDFGIQGSWMVRNELSVFNRSYFNESAFDTFFASYRPALIYNTAKSSLELIGSIDYYALGQESYINEYSLNPRHSYLWDPTLRQTLSLKGGMRDYDTLNNLDATFINLSGGVEYYPDNTSAVSATLSYELQEKSRGTRTDVDYSQYALNASYMRQLFPLTIVNAGATIKNRTYQDYSQLFGNTRADTSYDINAKLIQRLTSAFSAEVGTTYTSASSNQAVFSYDKYTLSLSLSGRF
jgi:tetratricopeptide (TPR) repeat protein